MSWHWLCQGRRTSLGILPAIYHLSDFNLAEINTSGPSSLGKQEENKVCGVVPCICSQTTVTIRSPGDWNREGLLQSHKEGKKISVGPGPVSCTHSGAALWEGLLPLLLATLPVWAISHQVHTSPCPGSAEHIRVPLGQQGPHLLSGKRLRQGL